MFSSLFSTSAPVDPTAPNFHPVTSKFSENELFGELEPKDTEWLCAGGFVTETQTWYMTTGDGTTIMWQIIHSAVGVWYPTIQFTCKIANPNAGVEKVWKSINVTNFVTPPPGLDKRSSKADQYSVTYKSYPGTDYPEAYIISANLDNELQVSFEVKRPATVPGWKLGKGPDGGYSYFGSETTTAKADGYVIHRFWPRFIASGHLIRKGHAESVEGSGMFVHAIQGMRPNLVASTWNFAQFQSNEFGGVSAIQMEFKTLESHGKHGAGSGPVLVNIGSIVVGNKLVAITAETKWPGEESSNNVISRVEHLKSEDDPDTGYQQPGELLFNWKAPSLIVDAPGTVEAKLLAELGTVEQSKGLIEKVDVLAEIPYAIKMVVNYVAGTKPYIYQWSNPAKLSITLPDNVLPDHSTSVEVSGHVYTECSFIS